jgi:hypothetical protein
VREELQCGGCRRIHTGATGPCVETSETVEEKVADEIRRHCELLVEDLEVIRCEQTMALVEAEGRLWRDEPEAKAAKRRWRPDATNSEEPRTASSLHPYEGRGRSNAAQI